MSLHLSPPCLTLWVPWAAWVYTCLPLVSHSGCLWPHEFTFVSHMSPTCRALVSHTCLPLWVSWAALGLHLSPPCPQTPDGTRSFASAISFFITPASHRKASIKSAFDMTRLGSSYLPTKGTFDANSLSAQMFKRATCPWTRRAAMQKGQVEQAVWLFKHFKVRLQPLPACRIRLWNRKAQSHLLWHPINVYILQHHPRWKSAPRANNASSHSSFTSAAFRGAPMARTGERFASAMPLSSTSSMTKPDLLCHCTASVR